MYKCLIIDESHDSIVPLLKEIGVEGHYRPEITAEEVHNIVADYDGMIVRSKMYLGEELFQKATKLKFIARAGAGIDQIDEEAVAKRNIVLFNAPEGNRDAVGEQAVGMILCLLNKIHTADREVRQLVWRREENRGYELGEMTVGIIGYGNMGKAFAKRLTGFGCKVLSYDKFKKNYGDENAEEVSIETIFEETDVLSFHIPLIDENKYMADTSFFNKFRKNIYLINTARGKVAPLASIVECLKSGKLIGAALDVLENEKLHTLTPEQKESFSYLAEAKNVLFTPHVAGWTFESYRKINETMVAKIDTFLKGL